MLASNAGLNWALLAILSAVVRSDSVVGLTQAEMAALACKTTAMASDVAEIREAAAVGRRLLERYGDDWWEARVVRTVDTGIGKGRQVPCRTFLFTDSRCN